MYISKKHRAAVKEKYSGRCAYSGTLLKDDWQVDHLKPLIRRIEKGECMFPKDHRIENMMPVQRIINHYKGSMSLNLFREWYLGGLHERLKKLPKNPKAEKTVRHKAYLLEVAELFGITEDKPFEGTFYFETFIE